ncbi:MAG: DALR domain-containing protein [Acidimicrobiales bacterium]
MVLRAHYRSPIDVDRASTADAAAALARLDTFARRTAHLPTDEPDEAILARFRSAMDDDLDTPAAVGLLFDIVRRSNTLLAEGRQDELGPLVAAVRSINGALGLVLRADADDVPVEVRALARQRDEARAAKDWARADELRDVLQADGWVVEDAAAGTVVRRP